ncbi:PAS domain S-box protein [Luteitalea sp.]|uniref:PAS domain S-box protein n=1 Tax=Luteitalea sp. TaxID=2004800 RepID=UPI0025BE8260|nr:PAS domain S-box protein [Luteitalea sp.]
MSERRSHGDGALDVQVLEALAEGQPLLETLALIATGLERGIDGALVCVKLVSDDGRRLDYASAPSLPASYVEATTQQPVGPLDGACGTAVHTRRAVFVEDIATSPLWHQHRDVALAHGLRACWALPVLGAGDQPLAAFAVYHRTPTRPTWGQLRDLDRFRHLLRIAVERDRSERELRASEERFRLAFRDAAFGLAVSDLSGRLRMVNRAFARMLGYEVDELLAREALDLTHPDDRADSDRHARELALGQRQSFTREKRYVARDGRAVWARVTGSARRDDQDCVAELFVIVEDISRQRALEQERRYEQSLLQMASRVGRFGAWIIDLTTGVPHLSREALDIHELPHDTVTTPEVVLAQYPTEHRARLVACLERCQRDGTPFDEEFPFITVKDTPLWVRVIAEASRDETGAIVRLQGALQDITERKVLEQQWLRSQRLESIGTLAGGIAHDLNNVLTPITMGLGLLRPGEPDPARQQMFAVVEASASRAAAMVRQVLSFARGAEGQRSVVSPVTLVHDVSALLRETLPKHITLAVDAQDDTWQVEVEPTQLHQVLLNLCVNARDAMPGGGTLSIRTRNHRQQPDAVVYADLSPGRYVVFSVEDTGVGISPDIIGKIFDPFFTTKPPGSGTGLGLSTSMGIARAHGGHIDVCSSEEGTRFDVLLPAAEDADPEVNATRDDAVTEGSGVTVLIVDDEPAVRMLMRHVLEGAGYRIVEADSGAGALQCLEESPKRFAVVVTDLMMPGIDGVALLRRIRASYPDMPVVATSGMASAERLAELDAAGLTAFLQKPYAPADLRATVERALYASHA